MNKLLMTIASMTILSVGFFYLSNSVEEWTLYMLIMFVLFTIYEIKNQGNDIL